MSTYALYVSCQIIFGNFPIFIDFFVKNQYEYNLWRRNETQKRKILNKMAYILSSQCISYNLSWYWSINPSLKFTLKKWAILGPYRTYSFVRKILKWLSVVIFYIKSHFKWLVFSGKKYLRKTFSKKICILFFQIVVILFSIIKIWWMFSKWWNILFANEFSDNCFKTYQILIFLIYVKDQINII